MLDQGSPQWVRERIGKLTASRMGDVMAVLKNGKPSEARTKYLQQLVAERMTDVASDFYVTAAMQWGIDTEPVAAEHYEWVTGEIVVPGVWVPHPTIENFGATPDRFVRADGLLEIKCPSTANYLAWRTSGVIPEPYRWQMVAQLCCTRRAWCDFMAFAPRVVRGPAYWIQRFEPSAEEIARCEAAAEEFLQEVEELFSRVTESEE